MKQILSALLIFIGVALLLELTSIGFNLMNQKDTVSFYGGLAIILATFSTLGLTVYTTVKILIKSIKK